jgi:hypothetical protein
MIHDVRLHFHPIYRVEAFKCSIAHFVRPFFSLTVIKSRCSLLIVTFFMGVSMFGFQSGALARFQAQAAYR